MNTSCRSAPTRYHFHDGMIGKTNSDSALTRTRLVDWSEANALTMSAAIILVILGAPLSVAALAGVISFLTLVISSRNYWTEQNQFGLANTITALRLIGILLLMALPDLRPTSIMICALALFSLDAIDGWSARKLGLVSEFGEYFDKEVDAFFLLALCLMIYTSHRLSLWIVFPGALRYSFVLILKFARPIQAKEQQNKLAKWIFFLMLSTLIFCFTPYPSVYQPLAAIMTASLTYSFLDAMRRLCR